MPYARLPQASPRRDARYLPDLLEDFAVAVAVFSGVVLALLVLAFAIAI